MQALSASRAHNRDPARYDTKKLRAALVAAKSGDRSALRRADALLANAFIAWARDLDEPLGMQPITTDFEAANRAFDAQESLRAVAAAPDLAVHLRALQSRHPIYAALADAMRKAIDDGDDTTNLAANLERARSLPADPVGKHIVVDAAGARLWMFDGRRQVGTMKTVIGRPDMATPLMSGMIRHVVAKPYWNVPEDIVRDSIAPAVQQNGVDELRRRDLEILSDWTPAARTVDPAIIDWQAVASGNRPLRVRQRPGPGNMMGRIKFMLPNELGIYLHDTPKRSDFASSMRARSSGCVRLEDATRLAAWLFDGEDPIKGVGDDHVVKLPQPVPVHISYFTLAPSSAGLVRNRDIYRRDAPNIVRLAQ